VSSTQAYLKLPRRILLAGERIFRRERSVASRLENHWSRHWMTTGPSATSILSLDARSHMGRCDPDRDGESDGHVARDRGSYRQVQSEKLILADKGLVGEVQNCQVSNGVVVTLAGRRGLCNAVFIT